MYDDNTNNRTDGIQPLPGQSALPGGNDSPAKSADDVEKNKEDTDIPATDTDQDSAENYDEGDPTQTP
jgi:hypothetical protein